RDHLAARRSVGALPQRSVRVLLGKLLGNSQQLFAALHLHPHVLGMDAGGDPEHDEIVEKVGAFAHHSIAIAVHGIDRHLDRLLRQLLGHLAAARAQQPRRPRGRRIGALGGENGLVKTIERITHSGHNNANSDLNVLTNMGKARQACRPPDTETRTSRVARAAQQRPYLCLTADSSPASSEALPPAAAVLMVTTCSVAKRLRQLGPPAFDPVPESPTPPNGCVPTTAPIMLRLT